MIFQALVLLCVPRKFLNFQCKVTCHGRGRGFESRRPRHSKQSSYPTRLLGANGTAPLHFRASASSLPNLKRPQTIGLIRRTLAERNCESSAIQPNQGLTTATERSSKCNVFRVASVA